MDILLEVKNYDRPLVLNVHTVKGKGFNFAEGDATTFHSPKTLEVTNDQHLESEGCKVKLKTSGRSFTSAFGDAMIDMMKLDEKVVACSAAMPDGTGIS